MAEPAGTSESKPRALLVALATTVITSITSVVLQMVTIAEVRHQSTVSKQEDLAKLDEARREMIKTDNTGAVSDADALYLMIGSPGAYNQTEAENRFTSIRSEFCRETRKC
ncbi:hypothetical protein [Actinoplanes sp. NPDC051494]|uniref:hypothetical protein n=1 Tax=Actinoplanes sp. NPDC051494 TaxID=3363907 RepID=UPI00379824E2